MLTDFGYIHRNGLERHLKMPFTRPLEEIEMPTKELEFQIINSRRIGTFWEYEGKRISFSDNDGFVDVYPSLDFQFMVATYINCKSHPAPNNVVIYRINGDFYKQVCFPPFVSELVQKRLKLLKYNNPPMELVGNIHQPYFECFCWWPQNNKLINAIAMNFEEETGEVRAFDPITCTFGECLSTSLRQYARIE